MKTSCFAVMMMMMVWLRGFWKREAARATPGGQPPREGWDAGVAWWGSAWWWWWWWWCQCGTKRERKSAFGRKFGDLRFVPSRPLPGSPHKKNNTQQQQQQPPSPPQPAAPSLHERPPPTLETLPEPLHQRVATMLPNGGPADHHRRSLAVLSKRMLELHGGTLTAFDIQWKAEYRVDALASLMQQQSCLEKVVVSNPDASIALSIVLPAPGCFTHVRELAVAMDFDHPTTVVQVQGLAGALTVAGPLQALETLSFLPIFGWVPGMLLVLARALASGACPSLRVLDLGNHLNLYMDKDVEALAAMLEARARRPACHALDTIKAEYLVDESSRPARSRLIRALLPTVTELPQFTWRPEYEACFLEFQSPSLKKFKATGPENPSMEVWEALPELEEVVYVAGEELAYGRMADVEPFIAALNRGVAFQRLEKLSLRYIELEANEWGLLLCTLAGAPCASHMTTLKFDDCNLCPASVATLAKLLGQDAFSMRADLELLHCQDIGDNGVPSLPRGCWPRPTPGSRLFGSLAFGWGTRGWLPWRA